MGPAGRRSPSCSVRLVCRAVHPPLVPSTGVQCGRTALIAALLVASAACGGDGDDSPEVSLIDAQTVRDAEDAEALTPASWGSPTEVGGVTITASDPILEQQGTTNASLTFNLRVENRTEESFDFVEASIECDGTDESGTWTTASTFAMNEPLPAGTFEEGLVNLYAPGGGLGKPLPECPNARLEVGVATAVTFGDAPVRRIAIALGAADTPDD